MEAQIFAAASEVSDMMDCLAKAGYDHQRDQDTATCTCTK
jgi:hypothetical protein